LHTLEDGFRFELRSEPGRTVLTVFGELDLASCSQLAETLTQLADRETLVIDLRQLGFIDSTGISLLVRTHRSCQEAGHRLVLVDGGGQVHRLLELTGLVDSLDLVRDLDSLDQQS
jgi:anti-sigma B factor antagonist